MKYFKQRLKGYMIPTNLQMFGDDDDDDQKGGDDDDDDDDDGDDDNGASEKKFTQAELDKVAGKTRKEAVKRLAKEFGMTEEEAREALKRTKEKKDADMTEAQKLKAQMKEKDEAVSAANAKATAAEQKVILISKKIDRENHDDIMAIAKRYMDEDTPFEKAVDKVLEKYPQFANDGSGSKDDQDEDQEDLNVGSKGKKKKGRKDGKDEAPKFKRNLRRR